MAFSLGQSPNKREVVKRAGCCIGIMGGTVLLLGLGWFGLYTIFSPSLWKTVIGEVKVSNGHKLSVGRAHDGDISYNYYVRVQGVGNNKLEDWTYVGWSLDPTEDSDTALTSDSRFAAIAFKCEDGGVLVIYDSEAKELWWNADDQWASTTKFISAWRLLYSKNPRLPAPP